MDSRTRIRVNAHYEAALGNRCHAIRAPKTAIYIRNASSGSTSEVRVRGRGRRSNPVPDQSYIYSPEERTRRQGAKPHRQALLIFLVERSKGLPEVVLRDVTSEHHPSNAREMVVHTCPEPRIDNLVAKIVCHLKLAYGTQVASGASGVKAMNVKVDALRAKKSAEDLGHRRCDGAMSSGVFRMVRRRQKRPPAHLLERRRVAIVIPWDRTKTVSRDCGRVDGCDWPPK